MRLEVSFSGIGFENVQVREIESRCHCSPFELPDVLS